MQTTAKTYSTNHFLQDSTTDRMSRFFFFIISLSLLIRFFCLTFNSLLVEEAYYWNYAAHLDFSYLDHPPMVAVLIKLTTSLLGEKEIAVRISGFLCWLVSAFFSFRLTELMLKGAGGYAILLLSILPFFFLNSIIITPDAPLTACWSASLYYLYQSLVMGSKKNWYLAGLSLGLGMLSKYTIVLLGPAVLIYCMLVPQARQWFIKKEPYCCLLIVTLLFTPVIYWNATHDWGSFFFQSSRRFKSVFNFSLHEYIGLIVLFLMPAGLIGFSELFKQHPLYGQSITQSKKRFIQVFTLFPLLFFGGYSLTHRVNFTWIGPGLLALIPWLAITFFKAPNIRGLNLFNFKQGWLVTSLFLLSAYCLIILSITFAIPEIAQKKIFKKNIDWENFTVQINQLATQQTKKEKTPAVVVPLDDYNLNSALTFYQHRLLKQDKIKKQYDVIGRHVFGRDSLMYRYWQTDIDLSHSLIILLSPDKEDFANPIYKKNLTTLSSPKTIWSYSQGNHRKLKPYYYKTVKIKPPTL
jgi:dolichol-phosphate mannosyltransferase